MTTLDKSQRRKLQYAREAADRKAHASALKNYSNPPGRLWDVRAAPWWNAPAGESRRAYYMTMRVHYEMTAADALAMTNRNALELGLGAERGFMVILREAIHGARS